MQPKKLTTPVLQRSVLAVTALVGAAGVVLVVGGV